ncbi:MAG: dynamin family protein, partial [Armatimonadetes bacterium]|nr:dynamin family protein [Armatimonadota bacterium]
EKGVDLVEVGFPASLLRAGLQLVDTPGVGSVYEHNTEAARRYLDKLDGAILVLSADPPISHSEVQFAQEVAGRAARLFVVLNKVDRLSAAEREEAMSFTRSVLDEFDWARRVEIVPLSARQALQAQVANSPELLEASGLRELRERLARFVEHEMAGSLARSLARRALAAAESLQLAAQLQLRSLHLSAEQIEERLAEFARRRAQIMQQLQDHRDLARAAVGRLVHQRLRTDYEQVRQEGLRRLADEYQQWVEQSAPAQVSQLLDAVNAYVADTLRAEINRWRREEEEALSGELGRLLGRFGQQAEQALADINAAARDVFELPERKLETVPVLPAQSHFRWKERDWEIRMGLGGKWYWSLLPPPLLRRAILAEGAHRLREHYDLACGRLRHDLENRVNAAAREYMQSVVQALELALTDLDRVLDALAEHRRRFTGELEDEGRELERQVAFLDEQVRALAELVQPTADGAEGRLQR